jgi:hypothetical protein
MKLEVMEKTNNLNFEARRSRVRVLPLPPTMSDERSHKAHHPSQSGKKAEKKSAGKKKHSVTNDKVRSLVICFSRPHVLFRPLRPDQVDELKGRVVAQQKRIKLASMFPL